jgi:formyltetrahydrofolate deformylase
MTNHQYALSMSSRSTRGQVAAIVAFLELHGAYIQEFSVFDDNPTAHFFVRSVFKCPAEDPETLAHLRRQFEPVAQSIGAIGWDIHDLSRPPRVMIMVSKLGHCLQDLLASWKRGEMPMQPVAIVSNHADMWGVARDHDTPFHHLPVTAATKAQQEQELMKLIEVYQADVVVLARYMQILSNDFCERLPGKIINIHHSFLPGFKGAQPYRQAFDRGVKLIGATAHFATPELDEGPIIDQATERVDHADGPEDLINVGRRMECAVLSRALRSVLEHRVFINGQRTVVLR